MEQSTREAYGKTLVELGKQDRDIVVLDADLSKSTMTSLFARESAILIISGLSLRIETFEPLLPLLYWEMAGWVSPSLFATSPWENPLSRSFLAMTALMVGMTSLDITSKKFDIKPNCSCY